MQIDKPVAWQIIDDGKVMGTFDNEEVANDELKHWRQPHCFVRPLYAAPQPAVTHEKPHTPRLNLRKMKIAIYESAKRDGTPVYMRSIEEGIRQAWDNTNEVVEVESD